MVLGEQGGTTGAGEWAGGEGAQQQPAQSEKQVGEALHYLDQVSRPSSA